MSLSNPSALTPMKNQKFQEFVKRGKELVQDGKVREGMECMKLAAAICPTAKVLSRIKKCEVYLAECSEEEEETAAVADGFNLPSEIYKKLYPYQREGIAWMWKLYESQRGGVLGDDMGLGKTIQVIGFLCGMFDAKLIKNALIVMPVSLLPNWEKEFFQWCPGITLCVFHGGTKKERERNLCRIQRRSGVLLTSYGLVVSNEEMLTTMDRRSFVWDYVILDEGHKIKNPTKTTKAVHNLSSRNRLVLTGTPIQNNLEELWALYDFAHQGTLLGSKQTFKMQYENPIVHARAKGSTIGERKLGTEIAENLRHLIEPYFLRRTKEEVLKHGDNKSNAEASDIEELEKQIGNMKISSLSRKNDLILWSFLSEVQYKIYTGFLQSESVKRILMTKKSPLVQLTVLKKICDHPRLLSNKQGFELLLSDEISEEDINREFDNAVCRSVTIDNVSDEVLIAESGKLIVLIPLLENLCSEGHRTLVFSQSLKILDIIQRILISRNHKVLRIDGTITKLEDRYKIVQLFQSDSSYSVLLLTTQVGGVGLTLTAADRVVIYDPSWNPATDAQAVDRAYRIGQSKNVVVYRLITCGSVEEKIYRRQIFKDSIIQQATGGNKDPHRYFSHQELYELFTVDNVRYSSTQVQLAELHSHTERNTDTSLDEHIAFLHSLEVFGISDHDLMFTKEIKDETEDNDENVATTDYIRKRVEQAQKMVQIEASLAQEDIRRTGTYSRPLCTSVPPLRKASTKVGNNNWKFSEGFNSGEKMNDVIDLNDDQETADVFYINEDKSPLKKLSESSYVKNMSFQGHKVDPKSDSNKSPTRLEDFITNDISDNIKLNKGPENYDIEDCFISPHVNHTSIHAAHENSLLKDGEVSARENNSVVVSLSPVVSEETSALERRKNELSNTKRKSLTHKEKSILFLNNDDLIPSANASAEILVSDSDSGDEIKSFSPSNIKHSSYSQYNSMSIVDTDSSLALPLTHSVIEDSLLDESESKSTSKNGFTPKNLMDQFNDGIHTPTSIKQDNHKLSRFVAMHQSYTKGDQKSPAYPVACDAEFNKNVSGCVSKDMSLLSQIVEFPDKKDLSECRTPVKGYNQGIIDDIAAKSGFSSPRRITPLKVTADSEMGVSGQSPFAKAVAQSAEILETVNMHPNESLNAEAKPVQRLNSSSISDAGSPIVGMLKKKNCRKVMESDSEDIDSTESGTEEDISSSSEQSSLKNFIVSEAEEEFGYSSDDSDSTSDEQVKKKLLKCAQAKDDKTHLVSNCDDESSESTDEESSESTDEESSDCCDIEN